MVSPASPGSCRTYEKPPRSSLYMGLRFSGGMWRTRSERSAAITARNETPLSPKQIAIPNTVSAAPAMSGPTTRARLNWIELSAIAFGRCFLSISEGTSD